MDQELFSVVVDEALSGLPDEFRLKLENIEIVIEDCPPKEIWEKFGHRLVLGLYQGVPLVKRSHYYGGALPDKISIYRESILKISHDRNELIQNIRKTLLHELGHYFGINDVELRRLGY